MRKCILVQRDVTRTRSDILRERGKAGCAGRSTKTNRLQKKRIHAEIATHFSFSSSALPKKSEMQPILFHLFTFCNGYCTNTVGVQLTGAETKQQAYNSLEIFSE